MINKYDYFDAWTKCGNPFMEQGISPDDTVRELASYGIRRGVMILKEQLYYNVHDAALKVQEVISAYPDFRGLLTVVPSVTGEMPDAGQTLAHLPAHIVGITLRLDWYRIPARAVFLDDWYSAAENYHVPVWYRAENMEGLCYVADVLEHYPKLNMVLSVSEMWPNARKIFPLALKYRGLKMCMADCYWLGGIENFCQRVGAEQLVFSTDYPRKYPGSATMMLAQAEISEREKQMIAHQNMEKLIGGICCD